MVKKQLIKLLGIILIFNLLSVSGTNSFLSDTENSSGNIFTASTLDFSPRNPLDDGILVSPLFSLDGLSPSASQVKNFRVQSDGSIDSKYQVFASRTGGDDALCNALQIQASRAGEVKYSGPLLGLIFAPLTLPASGSDNWTFTVSLNNDSPSLQNKSCNFDFSFESRQISSDGTWGLTDREIISNSFSTGVWTPSGEVVINEVMWMGSHSSSADEWIELRNTTDNPIDLTGWMLKNAGENPDPDITLSGIIPANGFFLLGNYAASGSKINNGIAVDQVTVDVSLANSGEELILQDSSNSVVDRTPAGEWPAGNKTEGLRQSMERNNDPSTGWHTCADAGCNDAIYWDSEGDDYGTPKAANLSGEPRLDLYTYNEGRTVGFRVLNVSEFNSLFYELTYDTDTISDGVAGAEDLIGQEEYAKDGITLGTCSSGGTCVYYAGVHNIELKVELEDPGGVITALEQMI